MEGRLEFWNFWYIMIIINDILIIIGSFIQVKITRNVSIFISKFLINEYDIFYLFYFNNWDKKNYNNQRYLFIISPYFFITYYIKNRI